MKYAKDYALEIGQVSTEVLAEKYLKKGETTQDQIFERVATQMASIEKEEIREEIKQRFLFNLHNGAIGAGRIMSSGGTTINATLLNCFVQGVGDSISGYSETGKPGIYVALQQAAETMRKGGGVGYNFSEIRPFGAWINSTQSRASGPCSYMDVFDKSCTTVEAQGSRRGAQMGMLDVDHPDILTFIEAKNEKGRWNNFNVSVSVTDRFIKAVENNEGWDLVHKAAPHPDYVPDAKQNAEGLWIYKTVKAVEIWDAIMHNTYDHAEPGIIFIDKVNNDNPLYYAEHINCTNPCVTADTWVDTKDGPRQVSELIGLPFTAMLHGSQYKTESDGFFHTGDKEVFLLETKEGFELKLTSDHRVLTKTSTVSGEVRTEWKQAGDLSPGEKIVLSDNPNNPQWEGKGSSSEGYLLGYLFGNGNIGDNQAFLPVWEEEDGSHLSVMSSILDSVSIIKTRSDFKGFQKPLECEGKDLKEIRLSNSGLRSLAEEFGLSKGNKCLTPLIEKASSSFYCGFLRGLFDADGTIDKSGYDIRLSQSNLETVKAVQRMLARLGIKSYIYKNRQKAGPRMLPDGNGGYKEYIVKENHEVCIRGIHRVSFQSLIGFSHQRKAEDLRGLVTNAYRASREMEVEFVSLTPIGIESVYDVTVEGIHAFAANGMVVHNCGEQPLPNYGCCDLGPIDLTALVQNPFGHAGDPTFDFHKFRKLIQTHVRFLDNVLDVSPWPLEQQKLEAAAKRRIGLGFTGLGNALAMLCLGYNTKEGLEMSAKIAEVMRNEAYKASSMLAAEKGSFPLFDAEKYLAGEFVSRLPKDIKALIKKYGIRNSHLLSIAPTGTVSLAFCNNASNGIEPPFSWTYDRIKREADGSKKTYQVMDFSYRLFREIFGPDKELPPYMITALEMTADDHLRILEVVQPFIDSAISKTVNIDENYPFDDFKGLYMRAWKAGLKGLATYRPNSTLGSVLSVSKPEEKAKEFLAEAATLENILKAENFIGNADTSELAKIIISEKKGFEFAANIDIIQPPKVDLNKVAIEKRPNGVLPALVDKVEYVAEGQRRRFYLTIGFMAIKDGDQTVNRPIEFFLKNLDGENDEQWIEAAMRMLSLAARGGMLDSALRDLKKVVWDRGPVRLGSTLHVEGYEVPKFHGSMVGAVAYAIENLISKYNDSFKTQEVVVEEPTKEEPKSAVPSGVQAGKKCHECGANAVVKRDGCEKCTNCGMMGSCG